MVAAPDSMDEHRREDLEVAHRLVRELVVKSTHAVNSDPARHFAIVGYVLSSLLATTPPTIMKSANFDVAKEWMETAFNLAQAAMKEHKSKITFDYRVKHMV